jgi:GAF domain-containing protein
LNRPQATNRDAIVVGVVGGVLTAGLLYGGGKALDAISLLSFGGFVPAWLVAVLVGVALVLGLLAARAIGPEGTALESQVAGLEARAAELGAYDEYAEHLRDALADLRLVIEGALPTFSMRDFVENGVFQPAHTLLTRGGGRGEVRFSVLHPDGAGTHFVMAGAGELFPALGHRAESRQRFWLAIAGSFSALAFQHARPYASNNLSADDRFERHPEALPGRGYESIVSVPLRTRQETDGVLNVIATEQDAFTSVDQSYIALLASVVDVARAINLAEQDDLPPDGASS